MMNKKTPLKKNTPSTNHNRLRQKRSPGWLFLIFFTFAGLSTLSPTLADETKIQHPATPPQLNQLADRLAILNLLGIYADFANNGDIDGWGSLFADDAIFEIILPDDIHPVDKKTLLAGEQHIFDIYRQRIANPELGERRIFLFSNPYVRTQNETTAEVGVTMTLVRVAQTGPAPHIEATGRYTGTLVKRSGHWLIHRWTVRTDRNPEPMLDTPAHADAAWEK